MTIQKYLQNINRRYITGISRLKDRKDRELSFEDILHYQQMVMVLTETERLMREIYEVGVE